MPGHPVSAAVARVGFFGKLPSRGDFTRAGLSRALAEAWDGWLRSTPPALDGRRRWPDRPAWRLALAPGLCGARRMTGVVVPSADAVGRPFPLLLAAEGGDADDDLLDVVERLGRGAVSAGLEPDRLALALGRLEPPASPWAPSSALAAAPAAPPRSRWWRGRGGAAVSGDGLPGAAALAAMLAG